VSHSLPLPLYHYRPLCSFGFGLSFTAFTYTDLVISPSTLTPSDATFTVTALLTRTAADPPHIAALPSDEVVQLYGSSGAPATGAASPPLQQLLGFQRLQGLGSGEARAVNFTLPRSALQLLQPEGGMAVQQGTWVLTLGGGGPSSPQYGGGAVLSGPLVVQ
jgi:hypothetical protein